MKLPICSFETAKQLKEIGFDIITRELYRNSNGSRCILLSDKTAYKDIYTYAPTLALVQMWLEEVHGIFISFKRLMGSQSEGFPSGWHYMFIINGKIRQKHYGSNTKALEAGILECIKIIKTKQDD